MMEPSQAFLAAPVIIIIMNVVLTTVTLSNHPSSWDGREEFPACYVQLPRSDPKASLNDENLNHALATLIRASGVVTVHSGAQIAP